MVNQLGNSGEVATTDSYVQVWKRRFGTYPVAENPTHLTVRIEEGETVNGVRSGVNAILYKIVASNESDGTDYPDSAETVVAETTIAKGASGYETFTDTWLEYAVYVKSAASSTPGKAKVTVAGGS